MSALPAKKPDGYTYEDYLQFPDDIRCEIIGGEIYDMTPAPTTLHQDVVLEIGALLRIRLREMGSPCRVFIAPTDVYFSEKDVVQPDVVIVCDREKILRRGIVEAPDVIFEVLSQSTEVKDRQEKMELYAKSRVKEYFLINPDLRFIEKHVFLEGDLKRVRIYQGKDTFTIESIGVELTAQDLFPQYEKEQNER